MYRLHASVNTRANHFSGTQQFLSTGGPFRMLYGNRPRVNFTNILQAAITRTDPKSAIKLLNLTVFFALLGSAGVKAACRMLVKLTPRLQPGDPLHTARSQPLGHCRDHWRLCSLFSVCILSELGYFSQFFQPKNKIKTNIFKIFLLTIRIFCQKCGSQIIFFFWSLNVHQKLNQQTLQCNSSKQNFLKIF